MGRRQFLQALMGGAVLSLILPCREIAAASLVGSPSKHTMEDLTFQWEYYLPERCWLLLARVGSKVSLCVVTEEERGSLWVVDLHKQALLRSINNLV